MVPDKRLPSTMPLSQAEPSMRAPHASAKDERKVFGCLFTTLHDWARFCLSFAKP